MTTFSKTHQTLIFFTGTLLLLQFMFVLSPHLGVKLVSFGLCLMDFCLFFWMAHRPSATSALHSPTLRRKLYLLLILQFSLTLPVQTSEWQNISDESFQLSTEELKTCLQINPSRSFHRFSCQLDDQVVHLDLPKHNIHLNIQPNETGVTHKQRYTYTVLDILLGLHQTQHPTSFQQSQFILSLSPHLATELNLN